MRNQCDKLAAVADKATRLEERVAAMGGMQGMQGMQGMNGARRQRGME